MLINWTSTYNTYAFNYVCIAEDCFYEAQGGYHLSQPDICGSDPDCDVFVQANSPGYTSATAITGVTCEDALPAPCESLYQESWNVRCAMMGCLDGIGCIMPSPVQGVLGRAAQMVADNNAVALNDTTYLAAQLVELGNAGVNSTLANFFRVRAWHGACHPRDA